MGMFDLVTKRLLKSYSTRGGIITGFLITVLLGTISVAVSIFFWGGRIIFPESGYNLDNFINLIGIPTLVVLCHASILLGVLYDVRGPEEFKTEAKTKGFKNDLLSIWNDLEERFSQKSLLVMVTLYFIGLIFLSLGQGIHSATNFLNSRALDLSINTIVPEFYQHVWFLDEVVGHWFAYTGFWIMIFLLGFVNLRLPSKREMNLTKWIILTLIALIFGGMVWVIFALEGEYALWSLALAVIYLVYFGTGMIQRRKNAASSDIQFPIVWFILLFFLFSMVGLIVYYFLNGGKFIQPSDLFQIFDV